MNTIVLAITVFFLSNASRGFEWFEGRWISDADASVKANPGIAEFYEDQLEGFRSLFGNTVWNVSGGMFTAIQRGTVVSTAAYSISPLEDDRFEIIIDDAELQSSFIVWPTADGFCAKLQPSWISQFKTWTKPEIIECYVPADA